MLAKWVEDHVEELLDRYVSIRIDEYHDTHPQELLRARTRPVFEYLVKALRHRAPWEPFVKAVVDDILSKGTENASIVSDDTFVAHTSIADVMQKHQVAQREVWMAEVAMQLLEASRHVARAIDAHLRQHVDLLSDQTRERERLQQQVIEAQQSAIHELSTPIIPVLNGIIVMPVIGSIDTLRARDIMRALLEGIRVHRARVVIVDVTGVTVIDTGVASHLTKAIAAARLKGAHAIVTGLSDSAAETVVEMGIDWSGIRTLADLQTGLMEALHEVGLELVNRTRETAGGKQPGAASSRRVP
jgi:anti-anti-sigma regulatory factor